MVSTSDVRDSGCHSNHHLNPFQDLLGGHNCSCPSGFSGTNCDGMLVGGRHETVKHEPSFQLCCFYLVSALQYAAKTKFLFTISRKYN